MKPRTSRQNFKTALGIVLVLTVGFLAFVISVLYIPSELTKHKIITVAAIGDSITQGTGVEGDIAKESYPAQLQSLLGSKYKVTNYGLGGRSLLSTGRLPYINEDYYKASRAANPNIVLIMLGTNDSGYANWNDALYQKELLRFVTVYKNLSSKPKVYLLTVPAAKVDEGTSLAQSVSGKIIKSEVVPAIIRVARITQTPVIDIYTATKNHLDLFDDGIHPNAEGYTIIANEVYNAIKQR
jgi:acyl-CoA thioesterase-1